MSTVGFVEAKQLVQDGDIIFVHGSPSNLIQAVIMFCTWSQFSHCCIAFHVDIAGIDRIMVVEAQGGTRRRIIPLSYYKNYMLTVVSAPQPWEQVRFNALHDVNSAKYNMLRAIYVGISEFVERRYNRKLPRLKRMDEICSDFVGDVYGIVVDGSPQVLYDKLMQITTERK